MTMFDKILDTENSSKKISGVLTGIVTNIKDPEGKNRVKVELNSSVMEKTETDFIRVASPFAGKEFGMAFFPEIGDEVLVSFESGDMERAFVIGTLFNDKSKSPYKIKNGKNDQKTIKTKEGLEINLSDDKDNKHIQLKTKKNLEILIDESKEKITISSKGKKNKIELDIAKSKIDIKSEKEIELNTSGAKISMKNGKIEIDAKTSIKLSSAQIILDSSSAVNVSSSGMLSLKSDGVASIKGATVKLN